MKLNISMKLKTNPFFQFLLVGLLLSFAACDTTKQVITEPVVTAVEPEIKEVHPPQVVEITKPLVPEWHKNATIYEVNLRQFTEEGTFKAFEAHLPRLKEMGIDILWFMPIHGISKTNRKGSMGSPYAVSNYYETNPDHGTMEDFKHMLQAIHDAGMYCIIDWVPNHSGWDNNWITEHPDWYTKGPDGKITDPIDYNTGKSWGWTDVADFNYDNPAMRKGMIDAMSFWVRDIGIDGFRVDVAHGVPVDFWADCSDALYAIKPIFLFAEAEVPAILNNGAFVMDYGWEMHHILNAIAASQGVNKVHPLEEGKAKTTALDIDKVLAKKAADYTSGYHMHFTSNHDENSWSGTEMQRMGAGHKTFAVLTATFDGMPLVYSGMESAMDNQLEFFEKETIDWGDYKYADFYKALFDLKHRNQALWNGTHGGPLVKIPTGADESVYAFSRSKNGDKVVVILNLSTDNQNITLSDGFTAGTYTNLFSGQNTNLEKGQTMELGPWEYLVYSNK